MVAGGKVVESFADTAFGQYLLILADNIRLQLIHHRTGLLLPEQTAVISREIFLPCLPIHGIQVLDEQQYLFSSGFIIVQGLLKLSSGVGKTAHQNNVFSLFKLFVYRVAIRLQVALVVFEQL